jgi:thiol-disulfide isomerase/thioredoxin
MGDLMALLTAAVVVVGTVGVINLVLTFGVIRRLREHQELLRRGPQGRPVSGLALGATVGGFAVRTRAGGHRSHTTFSGDTLVGFFSVGCAPCAELAPQFVQAARIHPGGPARVLAVVTGRDGDALADALAPVADVVVGADADTVARAFEVGAYPTLMLVDGAGRVRANDLRLDHLPDLVAA